MFTPKRFGAISCGLAAAISFTLVPATSASAAGGFPVRNAYSGKCLEVADWSTSNGAVVRQWECTGGANQQWTGNGTILKNVNSGKCLEIADWSTAYGAAARQWDCTGGANQQWTFWQSADSIHVSIQNKHSRLWLEIPGMSRANGTQAAQWGENTGYNQVWMYN
ncbi:MULTISPECIES: RICIN domain-containing protein [unclassified Streptomyces]|uniref:RICIN domain-containing protein n=1 Tax=unclassified Streptomyces TaxID=2593676 RepID=UPI0028885D32|nr:RICIN domain-containing protein [Streptomyces sp. DSM 41633]